MSQVMMILMPARSQILCLLNTNRSLRGIPSTTYFTAIILLTWTLTNNIKYTATLRGSQCLSPGNTRIIQIESDAYAYDCHKLPSHSILAVAKPDHLPPMALRNDSVPGIYLLAWATGCKILPLHFRPTAVNEFSVTKLCPRLPTQIYSRVNCTVPPRLGRSSVHGSILSIFNSEPDILATDSISQNAMHSLCWASP